MSGRQHRELSLIVGGGGFVGRHLLAELLRQPDNDVHVTKLPHETATTDAIWHDLDVCDANAVTDLIQQIGPTSIFHLAAQSSVARSWTSPDLTIDVNVKGSLHVLDAAHSLARTPRVLLVGSSDEYGTTAQQQSVLAEDSPTRPMNPYAMTKVAQNSLGTIYAKAFDLPVVMVRAFNHIGPGQPEGFVVSDFCRQVALIEAKLQPPILQVGNLNARRDFSDVRDIVRAYSALIQTGKPGVTYNVGSGKSLAISELLDLILSCSTVKISVQVDESKLRPIDISDSCADTTRITSDCGWQPVIPLKQSVLETLNWWRQRITDSG